MARLSVYYEEGIGVDGARSCMLINFWWTTFLISLHKEGGIGALWRGTTSTIQLHA